MLRPKNCVFTFILYMMKSRIYLFLTQGSHLQIKEQLICQSLHIFLFEERCDMSFDEPVKSYHITYG